MLASPGYVRAVLLRDPIDRFLSSYADNVVRRRCDCFKHMGRRCAFPLSPDGVARFMRANPAWVSYDHMAPQVHFCGVQAPGFDAKRIWNRIGYYSPNAMARVASELFDGRLDVPMAQGWGGARDRGMWEARTAHMTASDSSALFRQALCANRTVLKELRRAFDEDYEYFKLPEPDICSSA